MRGLTTGLLGLMFLTALACAQPEPTSPATSADESSPVATPTSAPAATPEPITSATAVPTPTPVQTSTRTPAPTPLSRTFDGLVYENGFLYQVRGGISVATIPRTLRTPARNVIFRVETDNHRVRADKIYFGTEGDGEGQFRNPTGMATDPLGRFVYVVDTGNHRVQKFTLDGKFLEEWGSEGAGGGQFL